MFHAKLKMFELNKMVPQVFFFFFYQFDSEAKFSEWEQTLAFKVDYCWRHFLQRRLDPFCFHSLTLFIRYVYNGDVKADRNVARLPDWLIAGQPSFSLEIFVSTDQTAEWK